MYFTLNARLQVPHSLLVLDGLDYQTAQQRIDDRTNCAAFWGAHLVDSRVNGYAVRNCWKSGLRC